MAAMTDQPGFISAAVLKPFAEGELAKLEATVPRHHVEVVAFWRSEEERLAWVARPIHDEVFNQVTAAADSVTYTLQTAKESWNL
jgi:heme-degrading monooxygenase HmoA